MGRLVLDMTPFCTAVVGDPAVLSVEVPGEVTAGVSTSGVWDAWVGDERVAQGPFLVELGVSRRPGRVAQVNTWSPVLELGVPFERTISLAGLLPAGDIASGGGLLSVIDLNGNIGGFWIGPPNVSVSPDGGSVDVALSGEDVTGLGVGRFTYSLGLSNQFAERRVVLAGVLVIQPAPVPSSVLVEGGDIGAGQNR